jgi:AcrR family transcriptional regulator
VATSATEPAARGVGCLPDAAVSPPREATLTGSRSDLDRDLIVEAALEIVDAEGVEGLSMRRLARRLGTAPMSLYRHVGGKNELVGLVVAALASRMPAGDPSLAWDEALAEIFTGIHELLHDHPGIAAYLSDEVVITSETLRTAESALDALHRAGLAGDEAARAFTALWTFTVGSVLVEQSLSSPSPDLAVAEQRRREISRAVGALAHQRFPRLTDAAPHWAGADSEAVFAASLGLLIDGIRARATAGGPRGTK